MEYRGNTKSATRDYRSFSDTPWGIWDTLYTRRSHRKYVPSELTGGLIDSLEDTVRLASGVRGAAGDSVIRVTDPGTVDEIRRRSYKGLANKINLWLARAPLTGFLVMSVPKDDMGMSRPMRLAKAAMAVEDCILWLTEQGLGTCWLGGVNQREIRSVLGFGKDMAIPAVVSIGGPKTGGANFDRLLYQTLSRHRKTLSELASVEEFGRPYAVRDIEKARFSAPGVQDVRGLLGELDRGERPGGDAPLDLVIDACLEAARVAPSASNQQPWRFVVLRGENLAGLASLCDAGPWSAAVVAAGFAGGVGESLFGKPFWMIDVPISLSHMSLMAASMGCGVELCIDDLDEEAVNGLVGLKKGLRTVGVLGIK